MKNIIKNLIKIADEAEDVNVQYKILDEVQSLIYRLATTINCPSNWRSIAEELVEEYNTPDKQWIYEALQLWDYAE